MVILFGFVLVFAIFGIKWLFGTIQPTQQVTPFVPVYGELPPISFSQSFDYPESPNFVLDNIPGRPVTATTEAKIYFIPKESAGFGYVETIAFMARATGFDTEATQYTLDGTTATYQDANKTLEIDITNSNFTFETKFESNTGLFQNTIIPDKSKISQTARNFLNAMNRYPPEFSQGNEKIIYMNYDPLSQKYTVLEDARGANVVEVDFYPPNIDTYPPVPPKFFNSQNYVVMVFTQTGSQVIKSQVKHFTYRPDTEALYPVKSGDIAYQELLDGKATIVTPVDGTSAITINHMFMGYYLPDEYQEFLLPVYVFLGENNFAAYVSAIDDAYIKQSTSDVD